MGICHRDYAPSLAALDRAERGDMEHSDPMDADSLCIGCVRWDRDCPIDPTGKVDHCVEYHPTNNQAAFERSLKDKA